MIEKQMAPVLRVPDAMPPQYGKFQMSLSFGGLRSPRVCNHQSIRYYICVDPFFGALLKVMIYDPL